MALNFVLLGPPGAGKGTQAKRIAHAQGVPQISTGDILREAVQSGSELGREAQAVMASGELVSDELMVNIVRERLGRPDALTGFVLDGFPRTVAQATALDGLMAGRDPLVVLELAVDEDELLRRLLARRICDQCGATPEAAAGTQSACTRCGGRLVQRSDDDERVIKQRFAVYQRDTRPLVDYYRPRPTFRSVDGRLPIERVEADLQAAIESTGVTVGTGQPTSGSDSTS